MKLNKQEMWMQIGNTEQLVATAYGTPTDQAKLTFISDAPSVVSVTEGGFVTALSLGKATVTANNTQTGTSVSCTVKVKAPQAENIQITVPVWGNDPAVTEEQFRWLREADVDTVMAVGHDNSLAHTQKMLDIARDIWDDAAQRNLRVYIHSYLNGITPTSSDAEIISHALEYRYTPALAGYHLEDEPFDATPYARLVKLIQTTDPNAPADVNFFPGCVYSSNDEYYRRLTDFALLCGDTKRTLSFDSYPFTPAQDSVNETGLFGYFEVLRRAGLDTDATTAFYLQAIGSEHFGYRRPDEGVLRYHIASGLSYGFKWIKYYSWYVPGATGTGEDRHYTNGIMDHNAQKTELYDVAATLNREVHNVGNVLVKSDAIEVYHTDKSADGIYTQLPADFFVQSVGGGDAIVSLMKDPETGEHYLMLVNKDFAAERTLSFKLTDVASLVEFDKTVADGTIIPDYKNGVLTRAFKPGEFAFYRLADGEYGMHAVAFIDITANL